MSTALVTTVPEGVASGIRSGYGFWCVIRGDLDWDRFRCWSEKNLPRYSVAQEDCMGGTCYRESHRFFLTGRDPRWFGFVTRTERDAVVAEFAPAIEMAPTGADQVYEVKR